MIAVLLVVAEVASFLILYSLKLRDRARPLEAESNPAYQNEPWAEAYWREHKQFVSQPYEAYPNGLWRSRPFAGKTIVVDRSGIRRTMHSQCGGDAPVVYVFGGSTVWGYGSPDWETIPTHLAKRFAAEGQPACVINMANDAWRSDEGVIKLVQELKRFAVRRPNYVVFADGCNDIFTPFLYTGRVDLPWNFPKEWIDAQPIGLDGGFRYLSVTNSGVLIQRLIRRAAASRLKLLASDPDRLAREVVDNYLDNIRTVDGLSRAFGFRYAFFWIPVLVEPEGSILRLPAAKTNPLIHAAAPGHFHDLTGIFDGYSGNLAVDACHVLPEGNRLIANRIYETLRPDAGAAEK